MDDLFDIVKREFQGVEERISENEDSVPFDPEALEPRVHDGLELDRVRPCPWCRGQRLWRAHGKVQVPWVCARCHPPLPDEREIVRIEVDE